MSPARPGGKEAARAPAEKISSQAKPGGTDAAPAPAEKTSSRAKPGGTDAARAPGSEDPVAAPRAFGGFGPWRNGYARMVSHAPGGLGVTAAGTEATVGPTLRAGDRGDRAQAQRSRALLSRAD